MTSRTAIVTDSSSCIPPELVQQHGITIVPLGLMIGGEVNPDGTLTASEMFALIDASKERPQSTSPEPAQFLAAFEAARDTGADSALCLTLSAKYSGTYNAALSAVELASERLPGFPVRAVDTGGLAMTHGFAVLAAARALESGAEPGEAIAQAVRVGQKGRLAGALGTMHYLVKGGRVPWIVGWAASILSIKPILAFEDGDAHSIARVRTMDRAIDRIVDYVAAHTTPGRPTHLGVMHSDDAARAAYLATRLSERFSPVELLTSEFTSVMSVHTGPGFVGVAFYQDE